MKITEEQLQSFCAKEDIRFCLETPYIQDGYVVASNGHICIRTTGEFPSAVTREDVKPPNITGLIDKTLAALDGVDAIAIPGLPPFVPCSSCNGSGREFVCVVCAGEGEFDGDGCEECGGAGSVAKNTGINRDCWFCGGSGEDRGNPVMCGDGWFARRYLAMIAALPRATIKTNGESGCAYFSFDGGDGAVMPIRK